MKVRTIGSTRARRGEFHRRHLGQTLHCRLGTPAAALLAQLIGAMIDVDAQGL